MCKQKRFLTLILSLGLLVSLIVCKPASALDFDFSGTIANHNDVLLFNFASGGAGNVTLFSSSWDDGGFDPILGLWNSAGNLVTIQDDGHNIGSTLSNGVSYTHGYWDSYYTAPVAAGNYTISLTVYDNFNNGSLLSNGFNYDGFTPIPITSWQSADYTYDTGNYAFHVLNVTGASGPGGGNQVPEPSTLLLLGSGLAGLGAWGRKKLKGLKG